MFPTHRALCWVRKDKVTSHNLKLCRGSSKGALLCHKFFVFLRVIFSGWRLIEVKSGYSITHPPGRVIAEQESGHLCRAKLAPDKGKQGTELGSIPDKKLSQGVSELRNEETMGRVYAMKVPRRNLVETSCLTPSKLNLK